MKKGFIAINIILGIAVVYLVSKNFSKDKQVVYINSPKLLGEYKGMQDAQKELQEKAKLWQSNVDTLSSELETSLKKFEQERSKLSKKEIELTEELLRTKQNQFLQYQEAMRQKTGEEDQKLTDKVVKEVNAYMKEYGKKNNYYYILGATSTGNLVYADEALDITDEVLVGLNASYKK